MQKNRSYRTISTNVAAKLGCVLIPKTLTTMSTKHKNQTKLQFKEVPHTNGFHANVLAQGQETKKY